MARDDGMWDHLLELSLPLEKCRLILQLRRVNEASDAPASLASDPTCAPALQDWQVLASSADGELCVVLEPPPAAASAAPRCRLVLPFGGEDVEVQAEPGLRFYEDHLVLDLALPTNSVWLSRLLARPNAEVIQDMLCDNCGKLLMLGAAKEGFLLPTQLWEACAEGLACEECAPVGLSHIRARPGCVYISPATFLVSAADLIGGEDLLVQAGLLPSRSSSLPARVSQSLRQDGQGLVRCSCGAVIGELPPASASQQPPPPAPPEEGLPGRPARLKLRDAFRRGPSVTNACKVAGIILYKHGIRMPDQRQKPEGDETSLGFRDLLHGFTEAAALASHLLDLRASAGHTSFLITTRSDDDAGAQHHSISTGFDAMEAGVIAVELRVVVREVFLAEHHSSSGWRLERAAKVYYRCLRDQNVLPRGEKLRGVEVMVPRSSLQVLVADLEKWKTRLPASRASAPIVDKDGLGPWQASHLSLPPKDTGGLE